jgi:hypothetical protein
MRLLVKPIRLLSGPPPNNGARRGATPRPGALPCYEKWKLSTPLADELSALIVDELSAPMFEQQGDYGRAHR